ncbi:MAG: CHAD domain-containing protein [Arenimonas sp.]
MPEQAGHRLKAYALAQLQRAIVCLGWRGSHAHDGVHQARKSMRRVRACLALGESALGVGAGMLDQELSKICKSLSSLRDAQARVESLDRLLKKHPEQEKYSSLLAAKRLAMVARAEAMRNEQVIDMDFLTRRECLRVLLAAMPVLPWQHIGDDDLSGAMLHSAKICNAAAEIALSQGREKDWHRLRRRRRRLIQQYTALENSGIELSSINVPDRKLGTLLGEAQDISILRDFFKLHSGMSEENRKLLRKFLKREFKHISAEAMAGP